jgi:hypothetical protein
MDASVSVKAAETAELDDLRARALKRARRLLTPGLSERVAPRSADEWSSSVPTVSIASVVAPASVGGCFTNLWRAHWSLSKGGFEKAASRRSPEARTAQPRRSQLLQRRSQRARPGFSQTAYLCRVPPVKRGSGVVGGEWLRGRGSSLSCARAPMLISVRDRAGWRVGDMMVMGCGSRWGKRCGRSVFVGRPPVGVGIVWAGAGRGASV